ncbi:MAG: inositol 2-dehydrogenase [Egibacteraceae bacterium]
MAVLGAGRIGLLHARNALGLAEGVALRVVADPSEEALEHARSAGADTARDWQEAVRRSDVDAVLVASPTRFHREQVLAAAEAGKHVFCEKPIDRDPDVIDELIEACEQAGVSLQTGFNRRFDRNFAALRERVRDGEVGRVWSLRITSRDPEPPPLDYLKGSGGLFADMAIHDFDMARFITGQEIVEVGVFADALISEHTSEADDVDVAFTSLRFEDGTLGVIENARACTYGYDQRVEVHGERGTVFAGNESRDTVWLGDSSGFHREPLLDFFLDRYSAAYVRELESFASACREGEPVEVTGWDGRQAVVAAAAADRSLREGRSVTLG